MTTVAIALARWPDSQRRWVHDRTCPLCSAPVGRGQEMCHECWILVPAALRHAMRSGWRRMRAKPSTATVGTYFQARERAILAAFGAWNRRTSIYFRVHEQAIVAAEKERFRSC